MLSLIYSGGDKIKKAALELNFYDNSNRQEIVMPIINRTQQNGGGNTGNNGGGTPSTPSTTFIPASAANTLTTGADTLTPTAGPNQFNGAVSGTSTDTYQDFDTILGSGTKQDTFQLTINDKDVYFGTTDNLNQITIRELGATADRTMYMGLATNVNTVEVKEFNPAAARALTLDSMPYSTLAITNVGTKTGGAGGVTIWPYFAGTDYNAGSTVNVTLSRVGNNDGTATDSPILKIDTYDSSKTFNKLWINSTHASSGTAVGNYLQSVTSATTPFIADSTFAVKGDTFFQVYDANALPNKFTRIDMTGNTGGTSMKVGATLKSYIGGDGNDRLVLNAAAYTANTLDGGTGKNVLAAPTATPWTAAMPALKNFQAVEFIHTAAAITQDLSYINANITEFHYPAAAQNIAPTNDQDNFVHVVYGARTTHNIAPVVATHTGSNVLNIQLVDGGNTGAGVIGTSNHNTLNLVSATATGAANNSLGTVTLAVGAKINIVSAPSTLKDMYGVKATSDTGLTIDTAITNGCSIDASLLKGPFSMAADAVSGGASGDIARTITLSAGAYTDQIALGNTRAGNVTTVNNFHAVSEDVIKFATGLHTHGTTGGAAATADVVKLTATNAGTVTLGTTAAIYMITPAVTTFTAANVLAAFSATSTVACTASDKFIIMANNGTDVAIYYAFDTGGDAAMDASDLIQIGLLKNVAMGDLDYTDFTFA